MQYKIIYSRRRSVSLVISPEGELVVRAPRYVSNVEIERLIAQKQNWIIKHVEKRKQYLPLKKNYAEGEKFWYLGNQVELRTLGKTGKLYSINLPHTIMSMGEEKIKKAMEKWYREQASLVVLERTKYYSGLMNIQFQKLKITGAKTRWGSCSAKNNINFSFRLVMAPLTIIDYVVVHELSHIVYKNHSQNFWHLVGKFYPNFREARKWLNAHSHKLTLE